MRRHSRGMRIEDGAAAEGRVLRVRAWRRMRLLDAGFGADLADALAGNARIDLHAVLQLVERGCPPALAARILAPADGEDVRR